MTLKSHLPNFITLLNLLCGILAIVSIFQFELYLAAWLILLGALFDFADGLVARLLNVHSEIGKQLDSLADVVTFGVAPGLIGYQMLFQAHGHQWFTLMPLMIPLFGALRLARFNVDTRQSDSFIGLPIPANALFWLSLPMIVSHQELLPVILFDPALVYNPVLITFASVFFSLLMISELKLIAMKFKTTSWADNQWRYILVLLSGVLLVFFYFAAIPIILLLYVVISLIQTSTKK
jgi:CDP-diacylglycerol--serine O-phosphatidyltransferase